MSLSREFAAFVASLTYDELPPEVVDRAKGVTLQALSSALVAHDTPASRQALALMQQEEAGGGGAATVLCHGAKLTKAGAPAGDWTDNAFRLGKWAKELRQAASPASPKGDWTDNAHLMGKALRRGYKRWFSE